MKMVKSASLAASLALDTGFRRMVLPLVLLAGKYCKKWCVNLLFFVLSTASLFRYNVPSLLYFLFMLVSVYLPDNSKKKDRS